MAVASRLTTAAMISAVMLNASPAVPITLSALSSAARHTAGTTAGAVTVTGGAVTVTGGGLTTAAPLLHAATTGSRATPSAAMILRIISPPSLSTPRGPSPATRHEYRDPGRPSH